MMFHFEIHNKAVVDKMKRASADESEVGVLIWNCKKKVDVY